MQYSHYGITNIQKLQTTGVQTGWRERIGILFKLFPIVSSRRDHELATYLVLYAHHQENGCMQSVEIDDRFTCVHWWHMKGMCFCIGMMRMKRLCCFQNLWDVDVAVVKWCGTTWARYGNDIFRYFVIAKNSLHSNLTKFKFIPSLV